MLIYHFVGDNLGITVIIIAVLIRLLLIPATKSQLGMTKKMSQLKPRLDELNKKYAHNKEELARQQMKLYKEVGYNPLGCFSSLVPQILILFAIVQVIQIVTKSNFNLYPFVQNLIHFSGTIHKNFIGLNLSENFSQVSKNGGYFSAGSIYLFSLALLVGVTQYWSTRFMQFFQNPDQYKNAVKKPMNEQMSPEEMQLQMMNSMNSVFPIMTFIFTLSTPAVLGVYWVAQSIMFVVQYFLIDSKKAVEALKYSFGIKSKN